MIMCPSSERTMTWSVITALFYVNKQLSLETIDYFYKKNLFVYISRSQTAGPFSQDLAMGPLTDVIPFKYVRTPVPQTRENEGSMPLENPPTLLKIKFTEGVLPTHMEIEAGIGAVMSAAHLPILVQVLNGYHTQSTHPGWRILTTPITKLLLDFKSTSKHYPENRLQACKLADALKGLGSWVLEWHDPPVPPSLEVQNWIHGNTLPLSNLPPLKMEETAAEARRIQAYADTLLKAGNSMAAKIQYTVAYYMLIQYIWSLYYLKLDPEHLVNEFLDGMDFPSMLERVAFLLGSWLGFSIALDTLGDYWHAKQFATLAVRFVANLKIWSHPEAGELYTNAISYFCRKVLQLGTIRYLGMARNLLSHAGDEEGMVEFRRQYDAALELEVTRKPGNFKDVKKLLERVERRKSSQCIAFSKPSDAFFEAGLFELGD